MGLAQPSQKPKCEIRKAGARMKRSYTSGIKCFGIACVAVLVIISLYYASVPALDARRIANMRPNYPGESGRQVEVYPATVANDLPAGSQADNAINADTAVAMK